ncbi:hypothetical protein [Leptospira alexanderi]|uniref:hypothetical protein n=1 Tax=Leptospira alexanderi TaxID=100053 RepID=UPI000990BA0B|nr:hypothetical protein [Leptospira alexanderi]
MDLDIVGISINAVYFPNMSAMSYWTFASYASLADVWVLQYEAVITVKGATALYLQILDFYLVGLDSDSILPEPIYILWNRSNPNPY